MGLAAAVGRLRGCALRDGEGLLPGTPPGSFQKSHRGQGQWLKGFSGDQESNCDRAPGPDSPLGSGLFPDPLGLGCASGCPRWLALEAGF